MTSLAKWLGTAAAAGAFAFTPLVHADGRGGSHASGGHWSGGNSGVSADHHGWSGGRWSHPHWAGTHWNGGHWGYNGGWYARPRVGFYFGFPIFWGPWWDSYYYPGYYYPGERVVYRERVEDPQLMDGTPAAPAEGATAAPAAPPANPMSTNYCASAKAYFPQVRTCPEGWQQTSPTS